MTFEELIRKDFTIENGKFHERNNCVPTGYELRKFGGWGGGIEFQVTGNGQYGEYTVKQDGYKDWYLCRGYNQIKRLYHQGGENWKSWY